MRGPATACRVGRSMKEIIYFWRLRSIQWWFHEYQIMDKLSFKTISDLVIYTIKNGMISARKGLSLIILYPENCRR